MATADPLVVCTSEESSKHRITGFIRPCRNLFEESRGKLRQVPTQEGDPVNS